MLPRFDLAIPGLLEREGGLVDHSSDPGGITNFGISLRAYPELGAAGIRNLTPEAAAGLYRRDYWEAAKLHKLGDHRVAVAIFDFAVHSGTRRAVLEAQRLVGVADDGRIGPQTIGALRWVDSPGFVATYLFARARFLLELAARPSNRVFLRGWLLRLCDLEEELRSRSLEDPSTRGRMEGVQ